LHTHAFDFRKWANLKGKTCATISQPGKELEPLADYGTKGGFIDQNFYTSFFSCKPTTFLLKPKTWMNKPKFAWVPARMHRQHDDEDGLKP
jgi:hypothetical protein